MMAPCPTCHARVKLERRDGRAHLMPHGCGADDALAMLPRV